MRNAMYFCAVSHPGPHGPRYGFPTKYPVRPTACDAWGREHVSRNPYRVPYYHRFDWPGRRLKSVAWTPVSRRIRPPPSRWHPFPISWSEDRQPCPTPLRSFGAPRKTEPPQTMLGRSTGPRPPEGWRPMSASPRSLSRTNGSSPFEPRQSWIAESQGRGAPEAWPRRSTFPHVAPFDPGWASCPVIRAG